MRRRRKTKVRRRGSSGRRRRSTKKRRSMSTGRPQRVGYRM